MALGNCSSVMPFEGSNFFVQAMQGTANVCFGVIANPVFKAGLFSLATFATGYSVKDYQNKKDIARLEKRNSNLRKLEKIFQDYETRSK